MAEIIAMHEIHRRDELSHQLTRFSLRERRSGANPIEQFSAHQQLHDDVSVKLEETLLLPTFISKCPTDLIGIDFVQFDDVRVSLTDAKEFDFILGVDFLPMGDDLHREFFLSATISTPTRIRRQRSKLSEKFPMRKRFLFPKIE